MDFHHLLRVMRVAKRQEVNNYNRVVFSLTLLRQKSGVGFGNPDHFAEEHVFQMLTLYSEKQYDKIVVVALGVTTTAIYEGGNEIQARRFRNLNLALL